ncbi:MAG: hypothetical protein C4562_05260 [Actinobacteria bacterium]|nr:MAG: hypothetical protein C4562_05260 [Actinomycetota bacterium]
MREKIGQAFKNLSELEPNPQLKNVILNSIQLEKAKQVRRKLVLVYLGMAGSVSAVVLAWSAYGNALVKSDFFNMLSLIFSDISVVLEHWQEFVLSLFETFPVFNIISMLLPLAVLFWCLSFYFDLRLRGVKNANPRFH